MSGSPDLVTPEAAAPAQAAPVAEAPAPAASAAPVELATPEPKAGEGEAAAAAGQGAGTGEAAPAGGASEGDGAQGAKDGEGAANGAPETYADFVLPEGITMDPTLGADLISVAKELNLSQEAAQKLADLGIKQAQAFQVALKNGADAAKAQWAEAVRSDVEIGGQNLSVNMATAKKALMAFGTPELTGLLNETGLGQNPEFLRLLFRVGSAISEDTLVSGDGGSGAGKPAVRDHAARMYPTMK